MGIIHLNDDNFKQEVLEAKTPILVDFSASWCGPCRMLSPILEEIAEEHPDYRIGKVDVDESGETAAAYRIMSVPTLMFFRDGEAQKTLIGLQPKEVVEELFS